ncbi:hypothetical protein D1872_290300 [compost metagenome]
MLAKVEADPTGRQRWEIYRSMDDLGARLLETGVPQWPADEIARRQRKTYDEKTGKFDNEALDDILSWQTFWHEDGVSHDTIQK